MFRIIITCDLPGLCDVRLLSKKQNQGLSPKVTKKEKIMKTEMTIEHQFKLGDKVSFMFRNKQRNGVEIRVTRLSVLPDSRPVLPYRFHRVP